MLRLINHPEIEDEDFTGVVQLSVKATGGAGSFHITRSHTWDLDVEAS